jgi:uncharacterized protein involved in exopolysaccharide biosynthesis
MNAEEQKVKKIPKSFIQILFSHIWIFVCLSILCAAASIYYSLSLANTYRSETVLAPVQEKKNLGSLGSLSGLASAAGFNLGGMGVDKADLVVEILKSTQFISTFVRTHHLEADLIAAKGWDPATNKFVYNDEIYSASENKWLRIATSERGVEPSDEELVRRFREMLVVNKDKSTDFVKISLETYSPQVSRQWLSLLISDTNSEMKSRALNEYRQTLEHIEVSLTQNQLTEVRSLLFQLADEKRKEIIVAEITPDFALKTIDTPTLPEKKSGPFRAIIVLFSLIVAFLIYAVFCVAIVVRAEIENRS